MLAATAAESDLDLAFRLQFEEALAASLAPNPSSSAHPPSPDDDRPASMAARPFHSLELDRLQQETLDRDASEAEMRRVADYLRRRAHDERFALEILRMPDDEWDDYGDEFERPIEEEEEDRPFRLYFKGMEGNDYVKGAWVQLAAVGVAVCDPKDRIVLQIQKPVPTKDGVGHEVLEMMALIEGFNAVISLGIKRVRVFTDFKTLYNHITGRWAVKQRKIENLMNQVVLLWRKIDQCSMSLLPRCHIKFAFKLAKDAIDSQIVKNVELNCDKNIKETCTICLEDTDSSHMFAVDGCLHRFCFSCMKQHVEVKLLNGMLPNCPYDGCDTKLTVENSRRFLSPDLLNIMVQRTKEASIPVTDKVYCPYPKCSALMSKNEAVCPQQNSSKQSGLRKCIKCSGSFCIKCKVPWHNKMSCYNYKRLNPQHRTEEAKLQSLARHNLWRQCVKCNHMIELAEGCFHMTCRCGYEFCYTCGAEWRDKKATCTCPLWDEGYIWHDDSDGAYSEDSYEDEDYFDDDDDDFEGMYPWSWGRI